MLVDGAVYPAICVAMSTLTVQLSEPGTEVLLLQLRSAVLPTTRSSISALGLSAVFFLREGNGSFVAGACDANFLQGFKIEHCVAERILVISALRSEVAGGRFTGCATKRQLGFAAQKPFPERDP